MFKRNSQLAALNYAGRSIQIGGYLVLAYVVLVWYVLPFINSGFQDPTSFVHTEFLTADGILKVLRFFIPPIVMVWLGNKLRKVSVDRQRELDENLVGFVRSYSKIPISELASKVGLSSAETERTLARIRASGQLDIAMADGNVMLEREICKTCPFNKQQSKDSGRQATAF